MKDAVQGSMTLQQPFSYKREGDRVQVYFKGDVFAETDVKPALVANIVDQLNFAYQQGWSDASEVIMNQTRTISS